MADFSNAKIVVFLKPSPNHSKFLPQGQLFRNTTTGDPKAACRVKVVRRLPLDLFHVANQAHREAVVAGAVRPIACAALEEQVVGGG